MSFPCFPKLREQNYAFQLKYFLFFCLRGATCNLFFFCLMIIAVSRKCSRKCICNNIPIYKRGTSLGTPEVSHFLKQSPLCSSTKEQLKCFTSSRSVKLILWRSFSSSAWSGTDICVVYLMCAKE